MLICMQGHRFTLHGASAYTPRSIGLHSTEHRATLHGVFFYTAVRGKACALQLMLISIGLPDEKQLMGAYSKVPNQRSTKSRDERPQTGAQAPGSSATTKEAPRGRQRPKHVVIKHVTCSVALSGLSFVNALVPGVYTPVCSLSHLWCFSPDSNSFFIALWISCRPTGCPSTN